jgi:uncharacterized protein YlxW (UPF0749 family)
MIRWFVHVIFDKARVLQFFIICNQFPIAENICVHVNSTEACPYKQLVVRTCFHFSHQVAEKQAAEISELQQKVNDLEVEGASSFALQSAIGSLKEKLRKMQAELREKDAELKNALTGSGLNVADEVRYQLLLVLWFWPLYY